MVVVGWVAVVVVVISWVVAGVVVVTAVVGLAVVVVLRLPMTLTRPVFRWDLLFASQITAANKSWKQMAEGKQRKERT